ncbi:hypothetical protein [Streptomyces yunnanensis]|uniref:Uncharacterized protein n=1 Tax=Streptomyces yunnanensis TaxID=156453 RepID=A0A9X8R0A5_9ACTN|nr:hypothetical protein [Streptomyces yunnanensis]SHN32450.1 hypothetical protein SAMN05216268_13625 [Streptomyces yunnanensis]
MSTKTVEQVELGRFLKVTARQFDAGRTAPEMFSPAIDAEWHRLLNSPDYQAFCTEHAGREIAHASTMGAGEVSWARSYEEMFGQLPEIWFTDQHGHLDHEGLAHYRETGTVVAEWNCAPAPGDGDDVAVPTRQTAAATQ